MKLPAKMISLRPLHLEAARKVHILESLITPSCQTFPDVMEWLDSPTDDLDENSWTILLDRLTYFVHCNESFIVNHLSEVHLSLFPFSAESVVIRSHIVHFCYLVSLVFEERPDLLACLLSSDVFSLLERVIQEFGDVQTVERSLLFIGNSIQISEPFLHRCISTGLLLVVIGFHHNDLIVMKRKFWILGECLTYPIGGIHDMIVPELVRFVSPECSYFCSKSLKCLAKWATVSDSLGDLLTPSFVGQMLDYLDLGYPQKIHRRILKLVEVALHRFPECFALFRPRSVGFFVADIVANRSCCIGDYCFRFLSGWVRFLDEEHARDLLMYLIGAIDLAESGFAIKQGMVDILADIENLFPALFDEIDARSDTFQSVKSISVY
jgi:hypothetical protein